MSRNCLRARVEFQTLSVLETRKLLLLQISLRSAEEEVTNVLVLRQSQPNGPPDETASSWCLYGAPALHPV